MSLSVAVVELGMSSFLFFFSFLFSPFLFFYVFFLELAGLVRGEGADLTGNTRLVGRESVHTLWMAEEL